MTDEARFKRGGYLLVALGIAVISIAAIVLPEVV